MTASDRRPDPLARLIAFLLSPGRQSGGAVYLVNVAHDDDCGHWSRGECDCEPDVSVADATSAPPSAGDGGAS